MRRCESLAIEKEPGKPTHEDPCIGRGGYLDLTDEATERNDSVACWDEFMGMSRYVLADVRLNPSAWGARGRA